MDLIALVGKANSGKSASLRNLMILLCTLDHVIVKYNSHHYENDPVVLRKALIDDFYTNSNHVSEITIVLEIRGKIVCVTTYGDSCSYDVVPALERTLKKFGRCDVFACGRHDKNHLSEDFAPHQFERIIPVIKERAADSLLYESENEATANDLLEIVTNCIQG